MKTIKVPFAGFYNSIHSHTIDEVIEFDTRTLSKKNQEYVMGEFSYNSELLFNYAKLYLCHIESVLGINLTLASVVSPKQYNFETDIIIAYISDEDIVKMSLKMDIKILTSYIKDNFSNHDGFVSRYSSNILEWDGNVLKWDANQLFCLIDLELKNNDFDEICSMDDVNTGGNISEIVYNSYSPEVLKIVESA